MHKFYGNRNSLNYSDVTKKQRKNPWYTFIKILGIVVGCLIIIGGAVLWGFSIYLSPDNITKLIEEKSSEYLNAEIKIGKLNYRLFSTYPWLQFEVDSLSIISKSLDGINPSQKDSIPSNSNLLASVIAIKGKINVHDLIHEKINLKDIEIEKPFVNIVTINDSLSNFNIIHDFSKPAKLPQIDISEINVTAPVTFNFFSLKDDIESKININSFFLTRKDKKIYDIGFKGIITGHYDYFSLPEEIPLIFNTSIQPNLPELILKLNNLSLAVAGVSLDTEGEFIINKSILDISNTSFIITIDDIFALLNLLPPSISEKITLPEGLSGFLPVKLATTLSVPYKLDIKNFKNLSLDNLPLLSSSLTINDGFLKFIPPHGKIILADDIYLEALFNFNPQKTEETNLHISELRLNGEGISLFANTELNNLTGNQQEFKGRAVFHSSLMKSLSYLLPKVVYKITGNLKGEIDFKGLAMNFGKTGFKDITLGGEIESKSLGINAGKTGIFDLKKIKGEYLMKIPQYPLSDYSGTKLDFKLLSDSIKAMTSIADFNISGLSFIIDAMDTVSGNPNPDGMITFKANSLKVNSGGNSLSANEIDFKAKGSLNQNIQSNFASVNPKLSTNDKLIESRISHTPILLEYSGGSPLQTIMNMMDLDVNLNIGKGHLKSYDYLLPIDLTELELSTNLNRIRFQTTNLTIGRSALSIIGELDGLGPFMTSYNATPLSASADIKFKNVDINQLSYGYYGAKLQQEKDSVYYIPPMLPYTAEDSICVLIPRNITADIRLHSDSAEYMQYSFSPLSTDILVEDGKATLRNLTVGTPYCTAIVNWTYSTSQLDNIFMNLTADVKNFDFLSFYNVFPQLVDKMPEIKNLSGDIGSGISCNFEMFPNMFMDPLSLKATFDIKGTNMEFARQGKIEKITHLMLIEGDKPIRIQDLNITGAFHDNLLQINPFKVSFDDYQLELGGVNTLDGKMYYHFALEKSPFHLPFGVSLFGSMKHPEIKVGGTHIDNYRSLMVSTDIENKIDVNIMAYLRYGWLQFIQEAAKYEGRKLQRKDYFMNKK